MTMTLADSLAALRPLSAKHVTAHGERFGFLMADATWALGGLAQASNTLMVLLAEGLVDSEPVVINNDVHTLYRVTGATLPAVH